MKYEVGDEILVLHSNEEGRVVEILNDKMVMIEVRGVRFPAYMDQIDFPYFKRFTSKPVMPPKPKQFVDQVPKEHKRNLDARVEDGMRISLVPKFSTDEFGDELVDLFRIYLVNHTSLGYKFSYIQDMGGSPSFQLNSEIAPFQEFYLHDLAFSDLNDSPALHFEFSLLAPDKKKAEWHEAVLKLRPKQVFKQTEEMKEKNEPMLSFVLFEKYPARETPGPVFEPPRKGAKLYDISRLREFLPQPRSVVDLHIEKLSDEYAGMKPAEMLGLQLREFEKWYELAVAHKQPSLVIIHGVGSGRLREELHDLLKSRREVKRFVNQYDPRFGYGATEIFFN